MPRAPLPITSVTHDGVASSTTSKGVTPSSSLLRAHAPNQFPPLEFVYPHLSPKVLAGCCEPLDFLRNRMFLNFMDRRATPSYRPENAHQKALAQLIILTRRNLEKHGSTNLALHHGLTG